VIFAYETGLTGPHSRDDEPEPESGRRSEPTG
jgi:hypothetical protein